MRQATRQTFRLSGGPELSFVTAGEPSSPAVLLLHGFPNSARMFGQLIPELSGAAYVIAPDLPGFGASDCLSTASFAAFGQANSELLRRLGVGRRYVYIHDFGAPVGFYVAMQEPEQVLASSSRTPTPIKRGSARNGPRHGPSGRIRARRTRRRQPRI